jgi:hypothetical protein
VGQNSIGVENWRGYIATWTVKDEQLLLARIDVLLKPAGVNESADAVSVNVLPQVFSGQTQVFADWFSGTLIVPRDEVVEYAREQ